MIYKTIEKKGLKIAVHPKKRIEYETGQALGNNGLVYLDEREPYIRAKNIHDKTKGNVSFRRALFRCVCGNEWTSRIDLIKMNKVASCGCKRTKNEA